MREPLNSRDAEYQIELAVIEGQPKVEVGLDALESARGDVPRIQVTACHGELPPVQLRG